jgi:hypothetical protein
MITGGSGFRRSGVELYSLVVEEGERARIVPTPAAGHAGSSLIITSIS